MNGHFLLQKTPFYTQFVHCEVVPIFGWEYAVRSGEKSEKFAGVLDVPDLELYAWFGRNAGSPTHPVGEKKLNGLGLYDMTGNDIEWAQD